jgi:hypothetical protein
LSNNFAIATFSPSLPYTGISETFLPLNLPGNGSFPYQSASTVTEPQPSQEYGFTPEDSFAGLTEDMLMDQACYNSWMDIHSDYHNGSSEPPIETPFQNHLESSHFSAENALLGIDNVADVSFSFHAELQPPMDAHSNLFPTPENSCQLTVDTQSSMDGQSDPLSPSQWTAVSSIPAATSAPLRKSRDTTCKSACRLGAVVKKQVSMSS